MVYQFNQFTLDTNQYQLSLSDKSISIEPLAFDLLLYLIEHRDRVVTREELLDNLWEGKVVTDAALGSRLKDARKAVQDSGTKQRVIKTIHGRGYQFVAEVTKSNQGQALELEGTSVLDEAVELPERSSIVVVPFANMSDDPKQEYFSKGVTQDIITALSQIPRLSVMVRTPQVNDQSKDLNQFERMQGVRYALEGSVRKDGNRIRVSAQLIEVNTGDHVWAERYDRELDDIFSVQDDITHQISIEMRIRLSEGEKMRVLAGRTNSVEAWERLLKADELTNTLIHEDNLKARRLLEEAVQLDPRYAAAWTQLANTFVGDVFMGRSDSREDSLEKALNAANKALEVEEEYPTALTILGYVNLFRGDYDSAVGLMRKAVAREPRNAEIIATCAYAMVYADLLDDALEFIRRAIELSPISPMWYFVCLGMCYHARGENELAISNLREAIAMEPGSALARPYIISVLVETGLVDEAKQVAREVIRIEPSFSLLRWPGANFKNVEIKERITSNLIEVGLLK